MSVRKTFQSLLAVLVVVFAVSSSEPSYSGSGSCPAGLTYECQTMCQRYEKEFGSHIPVCVFEVKSCGCIKETSISMSGGF